MNNFKEVDFMTNLQTMTTYDLGILYRELQDQMDHVMEKMGTVSSAMENWTNEVKNELDKRNER